MLSNTDHPVDQGSVFFILLDAKVPLSVPEIGGETFAQTSGSGVAIRSGDGWTDIMTAGHVCLPMDPAFVIADKEYSLFQKSGEYYTGHVIAYSMDPDLCIIRIGYERPVVEIAESNPDQGDKVFYAGYPQGIYSPGLLHFFEGYYAGIDYGRKAIWNIPVTHGSSGSPVVNSYGELVGIVSEVLVEFDMITMGPSNEQIRQLINETKDCEGFEFCLQK